MKVELMRYRNDRLSYYFTLLGLFLDVCYLICLYSASGIPANDDFGIILGIDTIYNIVFMLFAFYTAEKVKTYALNWGFVGGGLGILQLPRIALPIAFFNAGQLNILRLVLCLLMLIFSAALMIYACVVSFQKSRKLNAYLKNLGGEVA